MDRFIEKHREIVTGTLSCFDRVIFKGCLPLNYSLAMEQFLEFHKILYKDLKPFVLKQAERIKEHAKKMAMSQGRPWEYFNHPVPKEERARKIAERDGIREGLVCVFSCIEPCRTYQITVGKGRPRLRPAHRKCLSIYYYFIDPELGFLHVRIQTGRPRST